MKIGSLGLLLLLLLASGRADAICAQAPGTEGTTLLFRGSVVDCRSALPEIEAKLNAPRRRELYERWAQPLRDKTPEGDRLWVLRPYEEAVADHLASVAGVIVTFDIESQARIPPDFDTRKGSPAPVWQALGRIELRELFLRLGGSSCDLLPDPLPTVLVHEFVCCDVRPSSEDSCMLELKVVSLPPEGLLERLRGGA